MEQARLASDVCFKVAQILYSSWGMELQRLILAGKFGAEFM